jgi:hypothetical protein
MKTNFITDSEEIKNGLLELGLDITEYNMPDFSSLTKRNYIANHLKAFQKNFCRPIKNNDITHFLLDNLINRTITSIFINFGYKISGLINFEIINHDDGERIIVIKSICVPEGEEPGTGRKLIDYVKALAAKLKIQKIIVFPIDTASGFYLKQGFIDIGDTSFPGYLTYEVKGGGKRKTRTNKKKRFKIHKKRKTYKRK